MSIKKDNCAGTQGTKTTYPTSDCPDCTQTATEGTTLAPQACIKVKVISLVSCSTNFLPEGCEKTVKIFDLDMEELFAGSYAEANIFAKDLANGVYYAREIIACEEGQTESLDICFERYLGEGDVKSLKPSCKCCEKPAPIGNDIQVVGDCNECIIIDFLPVYEGAGDIELINISEDNPVLHGTLTEQDKPYLYKFCPVAGYNGTFSFGFTITDTDGNTTVVENTVTIEIRDNCPAEELECEETTVTVGLRDTVNDTPITTVAYPIDVMSPFSEDSGTEGNLGSAANYAAIISKLNLDANKPAGITFIANVDTTKVDVLGTCEFQDIKLGDPISEAIADLQDQIDNIPKGRGVGVMVIDSGDPIPDDAAFGAAYAGVDGFEAPYNVWMKGDILIVNLP